MLTKKKGDLNCSICLEPPIPQSHWSNHWFRRFMIGPMLKWFNRVNRTENATGSPMNQLDRLVWSSFQNNDQNMNAYFLRKILLIIRALSKFLK